MHFIVSPLGSAGDIHPFLGVALALRQRGHEITFVVNGYFRELIEKFGLDYVEFGTAQEFIEAASDPALWDPFKAFQHIFNSLLEHALRQQYEIIAEHIRPGQTAVLNSCLGMGALLAGEKLGVPVATINLQPSVMWSDIDPPVMPGMFGPRWMRRLQFAIGQRVFIDPTVCPKLNAFRAELNLPPVRNVVQWWHSRDGVVCMFPKWFAAPQTDWPGNLMQTDFPLWDQEGEATLPEDAERFLAAGSPPLVFTPGSANLFGTDFFQAAVGACQSLRRRGILLTRFPEQIPQNLPHDVAHFAYLPFSHLLPRCAAVVHHGGVGSTAQGLAAGIPQLLMPLAHDQFDNAARIQKLGVGDWLKQKHFTASRSAEKLAALLSTPAVASACHNAAAKLERHDGCELTAQVIEQWGERKLQGSTSTSLAS